MRATAAAAAAAADLLDGDVEIRDSRWYRNGLVQNPVPLDEELQFLYDVAPPIFHDSAVGIHPPSPPRAERVRDVPPTVQERVATTITSLQAKCMESPDNNQKMNLYFSLFAKDENGNVRNASIHETVHAAVMNDNTDPGKVTRFIINSGMIGGDASPL